MPMTTASGPTPASETPTIPSAMKKNVMPRAIWPHSGMPQRASSCSGLRYGRTGGGSEGGWGLVCGDSILLIQKTKPFAQRSKSRRNQQSHQQPFGSAAEAAEDEETGHESSDE